MPELPDIELYCAALEARIIGHRLEEISLSSPFVLRSAVPPLAAIEGDRPRQIRRIGKRIAVGFDDELWLVVHLMVAGRLHWQDAARPAARPPRQTAACFRFDSGTLILTEAGHKKRASIHLVQGSAALAEHDPGGLEVLSADRAAFVAAITRSNHTLKRALTDPRILSGIGNAYSDEILHRARLSPVALTTKLSTDELGRLYDAVSAVLRQWSSKLSEEAGNRFPEKVTAFREGMAAHGRYGQPCPDCGTPIQRIRYAGWRCREKGSWRPRPKTSWASSIR